MTVVARPRNALRIRGRSFLALVLAPVTPLKDWIAELDALLSRSPGFFVGRPVILDLSGIELDKADLTNLIADLNARNIRIAGIDGTDPSRLGLGMPPPISGGFQESTIDIVERKAPKAAAAGKTAPAAKTSPPVKAEASPRPRSLLVDKPVRSGQSVVFTEGDVTVIGSVASGAEIVAGGSIHVYGTLRGRAIAGAVGNAEARVFCHKLEAELIAIDGLYKLADDMDAQLQGRPVQCWLDGDRILMAGLN